MVRDLYPFQSRSHELKQSKDISPRAITSAVSPSGSDTAYAVAKRVTVRLSVQCPQIDTKLEVKTKVEEKISS